MDEFLHLLLESVEVCFFVGSGVFHKAGLGIDDKPRNGFILDVKFIEDLLEHVLSVGYLHLQGLLLAIEDLP